MGQESHEFISYLTHEVRTSLTQVLGYVETIYDANQTVRERFRSLSRVKQIVAEADLFLKDLEHLCLLESGKLSIRSRRCRLEEIISETYAFLRAQANRRELSLELLSEGELPETILTDPLRVRQMLLNIVWSMIRRAERGIIRITARMIDVNGVPKVELKVDSATSAFTKVELDFLTTSHPESSFDIPAMKGRVAIGFSLVNKLAHSLGGSVSFENSTLGSGVAVKLSVDPGPLTGVKMRSGLILDNAELETIRGLTIPNLQGYRFLVVDDDPDVGELLKHFLTKAKASVDVVTNGLLGLERAKRDRYDLILMDLQMPELNGLEATSRLRSSGVTTPVVALTASTTSGTKAKCLDVGCDLYLSKPVSMETLFGVVTTLCASPDQIPVASALQI